MLKLQQKRLLIASVIALLPLLYFCPAVTQQNLLAMGDSYSYSILIHKLLGEQLRAGYLPLWNPYSFAGTPLLASIQPGVLYPPNWLFVFLPLGVAQNYVVIFNYHWALLGTYLLARALGLSRFSSIFTGVTFAFGGYLIAHLEQANLLAAAVWCPWLLWAVERARQAVTPAEALRWGVWGGLFLALQIFAGYPQSTWHSGLILAAYVLCYSFNTSAQARKHIWMATLVMAVGGLLLAAVQLLPTRELQAQGERISIPYSSFASFSMPPRRLLTFIAPYFFGGALPGLFKMGGYDYWWLHKYEYAYLGLLSLLLIPLAWLPPTQRRQAWFWSAIAFLALLLSLGDALPWGLHQTLYRIPIYNLFRAPYRQLFGVAFAASLLAGFGLEALRLADRAQLKRWLRYSSIAFALLVTVVATLYRWGGVWLQTAQPVPARSFTQAEIAVPLLGSALSLALVWWMSRRPSAIALAALLLWQGLDLAGFGWFTIWRVTSYSAVTGLQQAPASVRAIQSRESDLKSFRIIGHATNPYGANSETLCQGNLGIAYGLQNVGGYDNLRLPRPALLAGDIDVFGYLPSTTGFALEHRGLDLLNVKYLLRESTAASLPPARWRLLGRFGEVELYENLRALPRAWFVERGLPMNETDIVQTIRTGTLPDGTPFDPAHSALLSVRGNAPSHDSPAATSHSVKVNADSPLQLTITTQHANGGLLVVSEVYYRGWEAYVDGQRVPVERANYALRAVVVPAGEHRVTFRYHPASFYRGLGWSALGLAFLLATRWYARRRKRRDTSITPFDNAVPLQ